MWGVVSNWDSSKCFHTRSNVIVEKPLEAIGARLEGKMINGHFQGSSRYCIMRRKRHASPSILMPSYRLGAWVVGCSWSFIPPLLEVKIARGRLYVRPDRWHIIQPSCDCCNESRFPNERGLSSHGAFKLKLYTCISWTVEFP